MGFDMNKEDENSKKENGFSLDKGETTSSTGKDSFSLDKTISENKDEKNEGFELDKNDSVASSALVDSTSVDSNFTLNKEESASDSEKKGASAAQGEKTVGKDKESKSSVSNKEKSASGKSTFGAVTTDVASSSGSVTGTAGQTQTASTSSGTSRPTDKQNKSKKIWLYLVIGVAAIVAIVYMLLPSNNDDIASNENLENTKETLVSKTSGAEPNTNSDSATNKTEDTGNIGELGAAGESNASEGSGMIGGSTEAPASSANTQVTVTASSSAVGSGTLEEKARQVIQGKFGNGADRRRALGNDYAEIQARVNEIYRSGN
jgi:epidermal growth factor receptor substrate 15